MADTRKLTMVFSLDNGDDFKYNLTDPKDDLTKAQVSYKRSIYHNYNTDYFRII